MLDWEKTRCEKLDLPFLKSNRKLSAMSIADNFDPFKNPPSLDEARRHAKSRRIAKPAENLSQFSICPCCENIINNEQYPLDCDPSELIEFGIGYPIFFEAYKYVIFLLVAILVVSGGAFHYIITNDCQENCFRFLGFAIINLEIDAEQTVKRTTAIYVITSFLLLGCCILLKKKINSRIYEFEKSTINPSQYSVLLQNLPKNVTENQIIEWCYLKFGFEPLKALIIHDCNELFEAFEAKKGMVIDFHKQQLTSEKMEVRKSVNVDDSVAEFTQKEALNEQNKLFQEIEKESQIISKYANNSKKTNVGYLETGSCIVTFNSALSVRQILKQHEHSSLWYMWRSVKNVVSGDFLLWEGNKVVVCRAPEPREVNWAQMEFSFKKTLAFEVLFVLVMLGMMALAFRVQFAFIDYAHREFQTATEGSSFVLAFEATIMTLIIVCLNYLLRLVVKLLSSVNKPHSYTHQESSFCNYYTLLFVLNASLTIYVVHGIAVVGDNELLLYDIHLVMLASALSGPLYKVFSPKMWIRSFWRYYVTTIDEDKSPYIQIYLNELFEGEEAENADNFQYMYRMLIINVWFANIAPLGVLFSVVVMAADYWITKFMLLRVKSKSRVLSIQIAKPLNLLEILPLIYILGIFPFILKISTKLGLDLFVAQFYAYGITLLVHIVLLVVYLIAFYDKETFVPQPTYREVELGFLHNYESQNPLTRTYGEIQYLKAILKTNKLLPSEIATVKEAIEAKEESSDATSRKIVGLNRIKLRIQSTIINDVNRGLRKEYDTNEGALLVSPSMSKIFSMKSFEQQMVPIKNKENCDEKGPEKTHGQQS